MPLGQRNDSLGEERRELGLTSWSTDRHDAMQYYYVCGLRHFVDLKVWWILLRSPFIPHSPASFEFRTSSERKGKTILNNRRPPVILCVYLLPIPILELQARLCESGGEMAKIFLAPKSSWLNTFIKIKQKSAWSTTEH